MPEFITLTNIIIFLLAVNALTFFLFWKDKRAARNYGWRVPEKTLLTLAFIGGSPAALVARKMLRHKSKKASFSNPLMLIVMVQMLGLMAFPFIYASMR